MKIVLTQMCCIELQFGVRLHVTQGLHKNYGQNASSTNSCYIPLNEVRQILECFIFETKFLKSYGMLTEELELTRCHLLFYCTSYRLKIFRALLCPSSGARDYDVHYHIGRFVLWRWKRWR